MNRTRLIISFVIWVLNSILLISLVYISGEVKRKREQIEDIEKKVSQMKKWAEEIKALRSAGNNKGVLEVVDELSKKYGINLESARPSGNYIEVVGRGVEPSKTIRFIWELEQQVSIGKIRLKKNISDSNLNDIELFIEQK